jgi:hypothetical protein
MPHQCPDCSAVCLCSVGEIHVDHCLHFQICEHETVDGWRCACGNFQVGSISCVKCGAVKPKEE